MKKNTLYALALAIGLVFGPKLVYAATATPTPNATQTAAIANIQATQTAIAVTATYVATEYPTLTPTLTPTGTLTPSPTFTPGPKQLKSNYRERNYWNAQEILTSAGTGLATIAQDSNDLSYVALADSGATVRIQWTVPWDFKGGLNLFALMQCAATGETDVHITVDANGQHFNTTSQTQGTFSYVQPPAGAWSETGTSTNVIASSYGISASLFPGTATSGSEVFSRVSLPLPFGLNGYIYNLPSTNIWPGDTVNFSITRSDAGSTSVRLYGFEAEYDYNPDIPQ